MSRELPRPDNLESLLARSIQVTSDAVTLRSLYEKARRLNDLASRGLARACFLTDSDHKRASAIWDLAIELRCELALLASKAEREESR